MRTHLFLSPVFLAVVAGLIAMSGPAAAFRDNSFYVGLSPMFVGLLDRVTKEDSAKASTLGSLNPYHLGFGATFAVSSSFFIQPRVLYTLLPQKNSTGQVEERLFGFSVPLGQNFGNGSAWDWNVSLGILEKETKGNGGEYADPNGADFYLPSNSSKAKIITTGAGVGTEMGSYRVGTDLIVFGLSNTQKRSYNLMLTLAWTGGL
jgi:hypothetical protein